MNPYIDALHPYPFEKLAALLATAGAPPSTLTPIPLTIGEPKHAPPAFVLEAMRATLDRVAHYPLSNGMPALRAACAAWLTRRYGLEAGSIDPDAMVVPVNGTREALFAFVQAAVDPREDPWVVMPNPFYQIYEGATLLAGAQPFYLNTWRRDGYAPDLDAVPELVWQRCQVLFACAPSNPTGAVLSAPQWQRLIQLADRYDFLIAADECYADIYGDEDQPPTGLLEACRTLGRDDFRRCVAFHSLSKRSNLPGLRSGFAAGDPDVLGAFRRYRTYHGCSMSETVQIASIAAWNDDAHASANRRLYREKFDAVLEILQPVMEVDAPAAAFYLWAGTPVDDCRFARDLHARHNVTVLPGSYLSRPTDDGDPGAGHVRLSLVAGVDDCVEAARRIRTFIDTL